MGSLVVVKRGMGGIGLGVVEEARGVVVRALHAFMVNRELDLSARAISGSGRART